MEGLRQSNKGFTLAELCVVMVLISVLATVTTFGLVSWTHDSQYNGAQQKAETIYMAIKNKTAINRANNVEFELKNECLFCDIDDYKKYQKKMEGNPGEKATSLFKYISPYIYDKTILNAYIYVFFNDKGDVTEVYYSDRTKFYNSTGGGVSISNDLKHNEANRYENIIGFYSPEL